MKAISGVSVFFTREGDLEVAVSYSYDEDTPIPSPGSKKRTVSSLRMASEALRSALERLDTATPGAIVWGGFSSGRAESTDMLLVEKKRGAA
jgi:hypothetical protein